MTRRSNCVIFAKLLHLRREAAGIEGYLFVRWSRWRRVPWLKFPHVLYGEQRRGRIRMVSYKPLHPSPQVIPPLLFEGRVCWGDRDIHSERSGDARD